MLAFEMATDGAEDRQTDRQTDLATDHAEGSLQVERDACPTVRGEETKKKGPKPGRQISVKFHLHSVREGQPLPYWPVQPHPTLYQIEHSERDSIVLLD